ncbi:transposase [Cellulosimicrobium sp. BIT-GX5]|uniref:Transposase n=1 Tax=Cellulosimicrobium composti TaxID=2672572 RepID=A0A6N7ZNJ5_9MICO|nr:transposase [Cellulosimicrobium composti]MTG91055.1 transposase [Cellulosimicrobium composti]
MGWFGWDDVGVQVISASDVAWIEPFAGVAPHAFSRLVAQLREAGVDKGRGRPWKLGLEDRVLLVAAYWRTNLTLRQLAPLFGVSKSAAGRMIADLGPRLALTRRAVPGSEAVLIVDGTLVPTRDRTIAASSKNYRYSTNHQVVIDADTRLVVAVGRPLPGNRNDCKAWTESGVAAQVDGHTVIADGGYQGTGLLIPHRRKPGQDLPAWKEEHNASHRRVRARVEHTFARLKTWKILRDCRLRGTGVQHAMTGIAHLYNLDTELA